MGQRLNIEITNGGKVFASAYYHWDAFSESSANHAKQIAENNNYDTISDLTLKAIRLLEATGAGLTSRDLEEAKRLFPYETFKKCDGRNEGLLKITEEGIKENRFWEERRVTIDITNKVINFDVWLKNTAEDEADEFKEKREIRHIDFNPHALKFTEVDKLIETIKGMQDLNYGICFDNMPNRAPYSFEKEKDVDLKTVAYGSIY